MGYNSIYTVTGRGPPCIRIRLDPQTMNTRHRPLRFGVSPRTSTIETVVGGKPSIADIPQHIFQPAMLRNTRE